jgi:hypothetical protein
MEGFLSFSVQAHKRLEGNRILEEISRKTCGKAEARGDGERSVRKGERE